jgi:hypothetical protein
MRFDGTAFGDIRMKLDHKQQHNPLDEGVRNLYKISFSSAKVSPGYKM